MDHFYIVTRFGLGQKNLEFYKHELSFAKSFLFPSIINQSDKCFTFLLLCDKNISKEIIEKVEDFFAKSGVNLVIYLHDPFEDYLLKPDISRIITKSSNIGDRITSVRVDIDDAISSNYVEIVKTKINENVKDYRRIHLTTSVGVYYYHQYEKFLLVKKPNYSVVAISDIHDKGFKNSYDYPHSTIYKSISKEPLSLNIEMDIENVMWFRSIRQNSITRAERQVSKFEVSNIYFRRFITSILRLIRRSNIYPLKFLSFEYVKIHFGISKNIEILEVKLPNVPKAFFKIKNSKYTSRLAAKQFFLDYCRDKSVISNLPHTEEDIRTFYNF